MSDKPTKIEGKGEVTMSLYEINQSLISQFPPYDYDAEQKLRKRINSWEKNDKLYYMLLGKDAGYYTIFYRGISTKSEFHSLGEATITVLHEADYTIHSDEVYDDHIEIWVKKDEQTYAFLLFPYDEGVVSYG